MRVCVSTHVRVEESVHLPSYYSFLTKLTLPSKSAGWCSEGVRVCVCVFRSRLLDLLSTSSLVLLSSLPSAWFTLLLRAQALMDIQCRRGMHRRAHAQARTHIQRERETGGAVSN